MSLLTPVKVPVKVYRWDDAGAPALDKSAGCMMTIFKACLVTGYGTKTAAGWTMPFEDTAAGVKVFRPAESPHTDFYLRCSVDTGTEMAAQVYLNMTDINTGDLKLQYATPFKYAKKNNSGKWLLIASSRGVIFCCEQTYNGNVNQTGGFLYLGDIVSAMGLRHLYLHHSGGTYDDGDYSNLLGFKSSLLDVRNETWLQPKTLLDDGTVMPTMPVSIAGHDGSSVKLRNRVLTPIVFDNVAGLFYLPGVYTASNGISKVNFDELKISNGSAVLDVIVFGTGTSDSNFYFATDYWG